MPRGPKGENRPADVIGNAVHVMRIVTGEAEESAPSKSGRVRSGHKSLKGITPAMAAGLSANLWEMTDLAEMVDAAAAKPGKRGPKNRPQKFQTETPPALPLALMASSKTRKFVAIVSAT
jgi:hypothetical protein